MDSDFLENGELNIAGSLSLDRNMPGSGFFVFVLAACVVVLLAVLL